MLSGPLWRARSEYARAGCICTRLARGCPDLGERKQALSRCGWTCGRRHRPLGGRVNSKPGVVAAGRVLRRQGRSSYCRDAVGLGERKARPIVTHVSRSPTKGPVSRSSHVLVRHHLTRSFRGTAVAPRWQRHGCRFAQPRKDHSFFVPAMDWNRCIAKGGTSFGNVHSGVVWVRRANC